MSIELTSNQVEDIFRCLCSDLNWRIFMNNKNESEVFNKVINDIIKPIEDMKGSKDIYDKIIEEMENQSLLPKLSFSNK